MDVPDCTSATIKLRFSALPTSTVEGVLEKTAQTASDRMIQLLSEKGLFAEVEVEAGVSDNG